MFDKSKFESTTVDGVLTLKYSDEEAFKNGTEIPFKTLKEVSEYQHEYIEKATELAANEAKDAMEKDDKINKVIVNYPYSTSKRGAIDVAVDRSKTFKSMTGGEDIVKSTVRVAVQDPITKVSKSRVKELESDLTKALLG